MMLAYVSLLYIWNINTTFLSLAGPQIHRIRFLTCFFLGLSKSRIFFATSFFIHLLVLTCLHSLPATCRPTPSLLCLFTNNCFSTEKPVIILSNTWVVITVLSILSIVLLSLTKLPRNLARCPFGSALSYIDSYLQ